VSALADIEEIIERCKTGADGDAWSVITKAAEFCQNGPVVAKWLDYQAYTQAAIALLPDGAVWRKYTDHSASVYGYSPYNANGAVRYDGYSAHKVDALMICGAFMEMIAAPFRKQAADEARKAVQP